MAAMSGAPRNPSKFEGIADDMDSEARLRALMNRLRHKHGAGQHKSWAETTKHIRTAMADKRHQAEVLDRSHLQRCLDKLQTAVKVTNLQLMIERLESLSRQAGLKFTTGQTSLDCFISMDMFHVQISLNPTGTAREVKIGHHGDSINNCSDLVKVLNRGDFKELMGHLEGLANIYQINGDKRQKGKAYLALHSLEEDLNNLSRLQGSVSGVTTFIHKTPLGILQPRVGGLPLKLTYFVSPYDLLNIKTKTSYPMTLEAISENYLGHSVTIGLQSCSPQRLQTIPLMTVKKQEGKSFPSFSAISSQFSNSSQLPGCFVLKLQKPIPITLHVLKQIQAHTSLEITDTSQPESLISLIVKLKSDGVKDAESKVKVAETINSRNRGHFVTLPDQNHCYFFNGLNGVNGSSPALSAVMVSRIPFTHPTNVPQILNFLRQQLLFNTLIGSCVKTNPKKDLDSALVFEVTPLSLTQISITFEHPIKDSMATAEFDLSDITNVKCKMFTATAEDSICADDFPCKVIQRSLSVPVTMRAILRKAMAYLRTTALGISMTARMNQERNMQNMYANPAASRLYNELRSGGGNIHDHMIHSPKLGMMPPGSYPVPDYPTPNFEGFDSQVYLDPNSVNPEILKTYQAEKISKNPMLASLLDTENAGQAFPQMQIAQNSMLANLLGDTPQASNPLLPSQQQKPRRQRKRKNTTDSRSPGSTGRSPKRKPSEDEFGKELGSMDFDSNDTTAFEATMRGSTPGSVKNESADDAFLSESPVTKLASSLDHFIKQESKQPAPPTNQHPPDMAAMLNDIDNQLKNSKDKIEGTKSHPEGSSKLRRSSSSTLDDIINKVADGTTPLDPDIFTNKEGTITPSDFIEEPKPSSVPKKETPSNSTQFNFDMDILNPDRNLLLENNDEAMDLDMCDANAFGMDPVAVMASKIAPPSSSSESKEKADKSEVKVKSVKSSEERKFKESSSKNKNGSEKSPNRKSLMMTVRKYDANRSNSPQEALDLSKKESKSSKEAKAYAKYEFTDKPIDLTSDLEVARITSSLNNKQSGSSLIKPLKIGTSSYKDKDRKHSESIRKERSDKGKKRSSKHGDESKRKKEREDKKDKSSKKRKLEDGDRSRSGIPSSRSPVSSQSPSKGLPSMKPSTTIKITTHGGKMSVTTTNKPSLSKPSPTHKPSSSSSSSSSSSLTTPPMAGSFPGSGSTSSKPVSILKTSSSEKMEKSVEKGEGREKISSSSLHKSSGKSQSSPKGSRSLLVSRVTSGRGDSKLMRTPQIKIKPIVITNSNSGSTFTVSTSKSPGSLPSSVPPQVMKPPVSSPTSAPSTPTTPGGSLNKQKSPVRAQKSLSSIIDKLTKQNQPIGLPIIGGVSPNRKESGVPGNSEKKMASLEQRSKSMSSSSSSSSSAEKKDFSSSSARKDGMGEKKRSDFDKKDLSYVKKSEKKSDSVRKEGLVSGSSSSSSGGGSGSSNSSSSKSGTPTRDVNSSSKYDRVISSSSSSSSSSVKKSSSDSQRSSSSGGDGSLKSSSSSSSSSSSKDIKRSSSPAYSSSSVSGSSSYKSSSSSSSNKSPGSSSSSSNKSSSVSKSSSSSSSTSGGGSGGGGGGGSSSGSASSKSDPSKAKSVLQNSPKDSRKLYSEEKGYSASSNSNSGSSSKSESAKKSESGSSLLSSSSSTSSSSTVVGGSSSSNKQSESEKTKKKLEMISQNLLTKIAAEAAAQEKERDRDIKTKVIPSVSSSSSSSQSSVAPRSLSSSSTSSSSAQGSHSNSGTTTSNSQSKSSSSSSLIESENKTHKSADQSKSSKTEIKTKPSQSSSTSSASSASSAVKQNGEVARLKTEDKRDTEPKMNSSTNSLPKVDKQEVPLVNNKSASPYHNTGPEVVTNSMKNDKKLSSSVKLDHSSTASPNGVVSGPQSKSEVSADAKLTDDVFKAPTPKTPKMADETPKEACEAESLRLPQVPPRSRNESSKISKPVLSPRSDSSSPDNSLIIDCPSSPKSPGAARSPAARSPHPRSRSPVECARSPAVPSPKKVKSPMVRASPMSPSPVKSPLKGNPSPISNASPCIIDDDLMDEALGVPS